MTTIYLDPVQMDATASAIVEHARVIETTASLESSCSAQVPVALAGWLAEELRELALHLRMVALVYTLAALDMATRAQQTQANQSLVTAMPTLVAPTPTTAAMPFAEGFSLQPSFVGSPTPSGSGFVLDIVGALDPNADGYVMVPGGGPDYGNPPVLFGGFANPTGSSLVDVVTRPNNNLANILASNGPVMVVDEHGQQGPLAGTVRNPKTGRLELP